MASRTIAPPVWRGKFSLDILVKPWRCEIEVFRIEKALFFQVIQFEAQGTAGDYGNI